MFGVQAVSELVFGPQGSLHLGRGGRSVVTTTPPPWLLEREEGWSYVKFCAQTMCRQPRGQRARGTARVAPSLLDGPQAVVMSHQCSCIIPEALMQQLRRAQLCRHAAAAILETSFHDNIGAQ